MKINKLKLELFLRILFSSPVWCVHGLVTLGQAATLSEKEQFCAPCLSISTPFLPFLTLGKAFMGRRGSCFSGHSLPSAHYFLIWAGSLTWLGSQTQECFCSFKEGHYREAGMSDCERTALGCGGFFSPYWTLNCSLTNQTAIISWTFKPQIIWIVAREEADLWMCHLLQWMLQGQEEGMRETSFIKPKTSFNIFQN